MPAEPSEYERYFGAPYALPSAIALCVVVFLIVRHTMGPPNFSPPLCLAISTLLGAVAALVAAVLPDANVGALIPLGLLGIALGAVAVHWAVGGSLSWSSALAFLASAGLLTLFGLFVRGAD